MAALDKFARVAALRPALGAATCGEGLSPENSPTPGLDECTLAKLLGATIATTKYGNHLSIRNWYAAPQLPEVAPAALDLLCRSQEAAKTTKWRAAAENPVLLELAARIAERPVLVTFNGKTFDWPLLESRYLMTRCIRVPELGAHLDLLHPARAVWKLRLGSVRLVELERHVLDAVRLGWDRQNDVPPSMIPQFYFDYLRGSSPLPLAGVVRHNAMDLRGLAALFGKLNSLLDCKHGEDTEALDLFGLSRYLHRRGERGKAESTCVAARDRGLPLPFDAQARRGLAQMAKRRGEHAAAALMWEELLEDAECRFTACEQLAVYHERQTKNFKKALEYALLGLQALTDKNVGSIYGAPSVAEIRLAGGLSKRVARLEARIRIAVNRDAAPLLRRGRSFAAAD